MGRKTHGPILVAAIEHNDSEKVREVLLTHIKSKQRIQELCTSEVRRLASDYTEVPILLAASLPDPTIIKFLVTKQDVNINHVQKEIVKRKTKVKTPLMLAVRASLINTVEAILAMNADPNLQDHKLRTSLHHAVRKADYRMAKMLLSRGALPNIVDAAGNTPLHIATIFGHTELVKLLLRHDADMFKKGTGGAIPLHMASKEGHSVLVRLFCEYEVNVNMKVPCYDNREKAPIHVAAEEGHAETVMVLLDECGADPNIRDSTGETALHCACLREYDPMGMKSKDDYTETTKVLLNSGAHIDLQNSRGETPLHLAARNEFQKTVEVLLRAGSDPIIEDDNGYKPCDLATSDDTVTIQLLKSSMEERTRIMNDAMEVQAKGYSTSMIKPSVSSRSGLNINSMDSNEFLLAPGGHKASNAIYDDGYLQPIGLRSRSHPRGGSLSGSAQDLLGKSQSTSSSGGSKPPFVRGKKQSQSLLPKFRLRGSKGSLHNLDRSTDSSAGSHSRSRPLPATNGPSSPTDSNKNLGRSLPERPIQMRQAGTVAQRNNKETDSFWDVTPRTSTSTYKTDQLAQKDVMHQSYESLPDSPPAVPQNKQRGRRAPRQNAAGTKAIQIQAAFPDGDNIPRSTARVETTDDDSFFDDESFDTLDTLSDKGAPAVPPKPSKRAIKQKMKRTAEEQQKIHNAVSNVSLHSWLDEQADIIKTEGLSPPPNNTHTATQNDEYSVSSDISSVSKARKGPVPAARPGRDRSGSGSSGEILSRGQKPPPLPPKPGGRGPPAQRQQQQQVPPEQTVIKVIRKKTGKESPTSESTCLTDSTQPYGTGYYDSLNSRMNTEDSESIVTDSTALARPVNKRLQHIREHNNNFRTFKGSDGDTTQTTATEDSSDNANWEKVPVNQSSALYWEHTESTAGIFESKKDKRQKITKKSESRIKKPKSSDADSSDSLSWVSSSDDDDETTVVSQKVGARNSPQRGIHQQPIANRGHIEPQLSKAVTDELRFYKSMGDIQTASAKEIRSRMERKFSEGDSLVSDMQPLSRQPMSKPKSQPDIHRGDYNIRNMNKNDMHTRSNGRLQSVRQEQEYDDDDDEVYDDDMSERRKVTIGRDTVIPHHSKSATDNNIGHKIVKYDTDGKQPVKLVGGNFSGIFVHEVDKKSKAAEQGLKKGDQIMKLNNKSTQGMTREDAYAILKGIKTAVVLAVRSQLDEYQVVVHKGGAGDAFFVCVHFNYDASSRSEMTFKAGDVFSVKDTMPNGKPGLWLVAKMRNTPGPEQIGFIPNQFKATQIATSYKIAQLRAEEIKNKGGNFRKSFKRAKSLDRGMNRTDSDDFKEALKDVKSYERVTQEVADFKRPVVLLGLFCDSVKDILLNDLPDYFALPQGAVELKTNTPRNDPSVPPVNIRPIEVVLRNDKHCVLIISPDSIKYLNEHTELNAIVLYMCPTNKAIVKTLKARFAPGFDRKPNFMYDEALQFAKHHGSLFSSTVYYTNDGEWTKKLKDTIAQLQNEPLWIPLDMSNQDEESDDDSDVEFPVQPQPFQQALIQPNAGQTRHGRERMRASKTTDDLPNIPDEIKNVLNRHVKSTDSQRPSARTQSVGDDLDSHQRHFGRDHKYSDHSNDVSPEEESVTSQFSRSSGRNGDNVDSSRSSSDGRPKRSILKNRSQTALDDDGSGDADTANISSSSLTQRGRRGKQTTPKPQSRAMVLQRAPDGDQVLNQQFQSRLQQMGARQQYTHQKRETPL